jgi:hypothetical protein
MKISDQARIATARTVNSGLFFQTPGIRTAGFYKNLVIFYQVTRRHISEDNILDTLNITRTDMFGFGFFRIKITGVS